jgi:hypothetical protein
VRPGRASLPRWLITDRPPRPKNDVSRPWQCSLPSGGIAGEVLIVPLLVFEEWTGPLQALAAKDSAMLVWWGSPVECISALARLERNGALTPASMTNAVQRLQQLARRNPGNGSTISPGTSAACSRCAPIGRGTIRNACKPFWQGRRSQPIMPPCRPRRQS